MWTSAARVIMKSRSGSESSRNPTGMRLIKAVENEIIYEDKCVAYFDILGFKSLINNSQDISKRMIALIRNCAESAFGSTQEIYRLFKEHISIKAFSDNFCISTDYNLQNVLLLIQSLAYVQRYFALEGVFIRGGLSFGKHYENEWMIFSKGLIKSYQIEKYEDYPRIVVDNALIEYIENNSQYIIQMSDNKYFIDYLYDDLGGSVLSDEIYLPNHKKSIINAVKNISDSKILLKYVWLAKNHNNRVDFYSKGGINLNECKINIEELFVNMC